MSDPMMDTLKHVAEGTIKGDKALLSLCEAIITRLNIVTQTVHELSKQVREQKDTINALLDMRSIN